MGHKIISIPKKLTTTSGFGYIGKAIRSLAFAGLGLAFGPPLVAYMLPYSTFNSKGVLHPEQYTLDANRAGLSRLNPKRIGEKFQVSFTDKTDCASDICSIHGPRNLAYYRGSFGLTPSKSGSFQGVHFVSFKAKVIGTERAHIFFQAYFDRDHDGQIDKHPELNYAVVKDFAYETFVNISDHWQTIVIPIDEDHLEKAGHSQFPVRHPNSGMSAESYEGYHLQPNELNLIQFNGTDFKADRHLGSFFYGGYNGFNWLRGILGFGIAKKIEIKDIVFFTEN